MAKKKRRATKSSKSTSQTAVQESQTEELSESTDAESTDKAIERLIGQWNQLVSTTNWEKGEIICQWRDALIADGAAVTDYSDEAWAQLVGGVTGQHVGRLRRVYQRFGESFEGYDGLFWSHFQAALDWEDAEMWLEGAIHNDWSISQMRGKRWETHGTPPEQQQAELAEQEEAREGVSSEVTNTDVASSTGSESAAAAEKSSPSKPVNTEIDAPEATAENDQDESNVEPAVEPKKGVPLNIDVQQLPDDLAEAFESFKLAIIAHRQQGWKETSTEQVVECLNALKELTFAEE